MIRHFLPTIIGPDCRQPLSESTARTLVASLTSGPSPHDLAAALGADPAFAVWLALTADARGRPPFSSTVAAADWLAENLHALLQYDDRESTESPPIELEHLVDRTANTLHLVNVTRELAADHPPDVGHAAVWLALTADRADWRERSTRSTDEPHSTLPFTPPTDSPLAAAADVVAEAHASISDNPSTTAIPAAHNLWHESDDFARRILPALARQTARLAALETDFADTLETEKLASLAELAAGAGHEINNPLAVISARAQLLLREEQHPRRRRELGVIHTQALRITEMISDMMLFARPPDPELEHLNLAPHAAACLDDFRARLDEPTVTFSACLPDASLIVSADPVQIRVALSALFQNALDAVGPQGTITLTVEPATLDQFPAAQLAVCDDGPGIPPEVRRHLFDPFFSGRQAGRGIGMGLSKTHRIAQLHGGTVSAHEADAGGTEIRITLPLAPAAVQPVRRSA